MSERKVRSRRSDAPAAVVAEELKQKRDAFLHTFFKRGAELTEELVGENRRLREQIASLEEENASLRTQLASDKAIRDLLTKIDQLEREKARLLSAVHQQAEITHRVTEIEAELESFANLYVASFQLHSSLRARTVMRNVKELLVQLVGVRSLAVYWAGLDDTYLLPIVSEGIELGTLQKIRLRDAAAAEAIDAAVERTYLTGVAHVAEGEVESPPAACIPLQVEDRLIGVIVVYTLLLHKKHFVTVDRELFKLLGAHAGGAIVSANLFDGQLPTPEYLRELFA